MNGIVSFNSRILYGIIISFYLTSCYKGKDLKNRKENILSKEQLPGVVLKCFVKYSDDPNLWFDYYVINLDSLNVGIRNKEFKTGPWTDGHQFIIGDRKYWMAFNSNRKVPPFILYKKKLYYNIAHYDNSVEKFSEFGMIDFTNELNY